MQHTHGRTNNDKEGIGKETPDTGNIEGIGVPARPEREAHQETVEEYNIGGAEAGRIF